MSTNKRLSPEDAEIQRIDRYQNIDTHCLSNLLYYLLNNPVELSEYECKIIRIIDGIWDEAKGLFLPQLLKEEGYIVALDAILEKDKWDIPLLRKALRARFIDKSRKENSYYKREKELMSEHHKNNTSRYDADSIRMDVDEVIEYIRQNGKEEWYTFIHLRVENKLTISEIQEKMLMKRWVFEKMIGELKHWICIRKERMLVAWDTILSQCE